MPKRRTSGNLAAAGPSTKTHNRQIKRNDDVEADQEVRLGVQREDMKTSRKTATVPKREDNRRRVRNVRTIKKSARKTSKRKAAIKVAVRKVREQQAAQAQERNIGIREVRRTHSRNYNLGGEAFRYDPNKEYSEHKHVVIGPMNNVCRYCKAKKFVRETPGLCCSNGKVRLPPLDTPPRRIMRYMTSQNPECVDFRKDIRAYNAAFQMTSFGASVKGSEEQKFNSVFSIKGQVYHRIGSLLPIANEPHKFLQVYFIGDENAEVDQRCTNITGLNRDTIQYLQQVLHEHNHLIHIFTTALDRMVTDDYKIVIRPDKRPKGEHERRFNSPQADEIAVVIVDNDQSTRDIIIQRRKKGLDRISETHRSYDALQYPLIFVKGEDGYHFNIHQVNPKTGEVINKKVSSREFYAYRFMIRCKDDDDEQHKKKCNEDYNHITNCRRLFQQFLVDMYAKIEAERMLYIRLNQKKLRSEEYIHLRDAVMNDGNIEDIGKLVILPSSYIGSPRHMHEYAQDTMTYVRKYGRPDLFITFTCNASWVEIQENLHFDQGPTDRHDIIARVFRQKQMKFIDVITKYHIFGAVRCWMYTIEWQKRGNPHSHNLIWLQDKLHPIDIDMVIRAELPNPEEDEELYNIIVKHMIHGPCGSLNHNSPCMDDGKCTKKYPRPYLNETQTGEDGYPKYRRRSPQNGGFTAKICMRGQEIEVDNQWVVPYSPLLSKMFKAHINVEYCNSVKSIKYVCKYVNKGSDMAMFSLTTDDTNTKNDEIANYQMGRYINSNEAAWRTFSFPIHDRDPAVLHLAVHLENGQRVYFTKETAKDVATHPPKSTLMSFFDLCKADTFAKTLLYADVPSYYTWNQAKHTFERRKEGIPVEGHVGIFKKNTLGRVYTVHPKNSECFYLRLLLHEIRGPTCFKDLKFINGHMCKTYREACQLLGLLENDNHWELALRDAASTATARQIRDLFAIIITACSPSDPHKLWDLFKEPMSDDILYNMQKAHPTSNIKFNEHIFNEALIQLENKCLAISNQSLTELGLPEPQRFPGATLNTEVLKEMSYDVDDLLLYIAEHKPRLIESQKQVYNYIMEQVDSGKGGLIYLDAPGGTGKTYLLNLLLAEVRAKREIALAIASSGIAATLLEGGRTAHSALKLPLNVADIPSPVCNISRASGRGQLLKHCRVIIWDECTMSHRKSLEALHTTLQDLRHNSDLMGGALVVLSGDFRQTLPVIPKSTPADEINACLKHSHLWPYVQTLKLRTNMRATLTNNDEAHRFANKVLQIGEGTYPTDKITNRIRLTSDLCNVVQNPDDLLEKIYPNIEENYTNPTWLFERAILAVTNDTVDELNLKMQSKVPGEESVYKSMDTMVDIAESVNFPTEFLNSLVVPGMPPHCLRLKRGSPIILLRNLDPPKLCNGTRMTVTQLLQHVIQAEIMSGKHKGQTVFIPRIPLLSSELPFQFKRLQFPIKLAYAFTINKAQGQTLKYCGINLKQPVFSHGQLYVACSRVGDPKNLYIFTPNNELKNIVYKEVL